MSPPRIERRSLRYIRLAAYLAGQPADKEQVTLTLREVEGLLGADLPDNARFPSWWRNDPNRMHSRAWLTAGWEVERLDQGVPNVVWRRTARDEIRL